MCGGCARSSILWEAIPSTQKGDIVVDRKKVKNIDAAELKKRIVSPHPTATEEAQAFVEHFLIEAPPHLKDSALNELALLTKEDLLLLLSIDSLSLSIEKKKEIQENLQQPEALDKLITIFELTSTTSKARIAGFYETLDHLTSKVKL